LFQGRRQYAGGPVFFLPPASARDRDRNDFFSKQALPLAVTKGIIMQAGKSIRMERLMNRDTKRCVIVPMDHGVSVGPITGLEDMRRAVGEVAEGGADAVLGHKGLIRCGHRKGGRDIGLILHLSSSTELSPHPNAKTLTASVTDALKLGADGISMHVNLGDPTEATMLSDLGKIASEAHDWGMPLLVMIYARGPKINDSFAPATVAHCARVAMELGADLVKVPYTGDVDSFAQVVESCCVPVLIAGGPKTDTIRDFLQVVSDSIKAGGSGLSVGRNVFQHPKPRLLTSALSGIVHANWSMEQALAAVGEE
jgi:class I fructose-bisphosphate aldolase